MVVRLLLALGVIAASAHPATAQESRGLQPSTPWTLDYAEDSCALRRTFGEGDQQAILEFRRFNPSGFLQTFLVTSWLSPSDLFDVRFRFTDSDAWRETSAHALSTGNGFKGLLFDSWLLDLSRKGVHEMLEDNASDDWRALELASAARKSSFTVRGGFRRTVELEFGPLDEPMAALQGCIDELVTHWGIDVEAHKSLTRQAKPLNLARMPRLIDYPPKMLAQRMPGLVNVRLGVDEAGRVTDCRVQMPLSDPSFEETSCSVIKESLEFEPALDKYGEPIASYWVTRVHFIP